MKTLRLSLSIAVLACLLTCLQGSPQYYNRYSQTYNQSPSGHYAHGNYQSHSTHNKTPKYTSTGHSKRPKFPNTHNSHKQYETREHYINQSKPHRGTKFQNNQYQHQYQQHRSQSRVKEGQQYQQQVYGREQYSQQYVNQKYHSGQYSQTYGKQQYGSGPHTQETGKQLHKTGPSDKSKKEEGIARFNANKYFSRLSHLKGNTYTLFQFRTLMMKLFPGISKRQIYSLWYLWQEQPNGCSQPQEPVKPGLLPPGPPGPLPPRPPGPLPPGPPGPGFPSSDKCLTASDCAAVSCLIPPNCANGFSTPKCSCCPVCKRGPNKRCGPKIADCKSGYDCYGEKDKTCVRSCREKLNCAVVKCGRPTNCEYGIGKPRCKCCEFCLSGPGQKCGELDIACGKDYKCVGEVTDGDTYTPGVCQPKNPQIGDVKCPYEFACPAVLCPPVKCKYGSIKPPCGCCPICRKDLYGKCGITEGYCKKDLVCQIREGSKNFGYCVRKGVNKNIRDVCPDPVLCPAIYIPPPTDCPCGAGTPLCGCVPGCLSCAGGFCGLRLGSCGGGLQCRTPEGPFAPGRCEPKSDPGCPNMPDCSKLICPLIRCSHGSYTPKCKCCKNCMLAPNSECAPGEIPCGRGLECVKGKCTEIVGGGSVLCPYKHSCEDSPPSLKPPPRCEYGSQIPPCGCYPECIKGAGERCGYNIAVCRSDLICQVDAPRTIGYCVPKGRTDLSTTKCPERLLCPEILRPLPTNCECGIGQSPCGCFKVCNSCGGGKCGLNLSPCQKGLECDARGPPFSSGVCRSPTNSKCPNLDCSRVSCFVFPTGCKYGIGNSPCGCCFSCLKGPGESCRTDGVPCSHGQKCQNGKCVANLDTCLTPSDCATVSCGLLPNCPYGLSTPKGSCCPVCNQGPNKRCGPKIANCKSGYDCYGEKDKTCVRSCRDKLNCAVVRCGPPTNCKYGTGKPRCSCCEVCLSGPGQKCGELDIACGKGYKCVGEVTDGATYKPGVCQPKNPQIGDVKCPYEFGCAAVLCPSVKCKYGSIKPPCGCCPICRKGLHEKCGLKEGYCKNDLVCQVEEGSTKLGYCVRKGRTDLSKINCPELFFCPLVVLPPPTNCECGIGGSPCGCFKVCNSCGGGQCGLTIAPCQKGLECDARGPPFSAGVCRSPTNSKCPNLDCSRVRCLIFPTGCKYGIGNSPCGCCFSCLKGPGEACRTDGVPCSHGQKCQHGKCVANSDKCLTPSDCATVSCGLPPNCPYGLSTPKCSCCPVCNQGPNKRCGPKIANCRSGYDCYGEKDKTCVRSCREKLNCAAVKCGRPTNCQYGIGKPRCKCCEVCLSGPGQKCGELDIACGKDYNCVGEVTDGATYKPGVCRPKKCSDVGACVIPTGCKYGYATPKTKCCPVCRRGPGEGCGPHIAMCKKGYTCDQYTLTGAEDLIGCRLTCPPRPHCASLRCAAPSSEACKFGVGTARCKCCPACLAGPDEDCGDNTVPCAKGLKCVGEEYDGTTYKPGTCFSEISGHSCPFRFACPNKCTVPENCHYGFAKPLCGCCAVCRKGKDERCGALVAKCEKGLQCKISGGKYSDGVCVSEKDPDCPNKPDCTKLLCPPIRCLYGSITPKCSCCPVCKLGPGANCDSKKIPCGSGLECQDGQCQEPKTPPKTCPYDHPCTRQVCQKPKHCEFGIGEAPCECCPSCKKGLNKSCGINEGLCADQYVCVGERHSPTRFIPGKCEIKANIPGPKDCSGVRCFYYPPSCKYGRTIYGCCSACKKGPGEDCGKGQIPCGDKLVCKHGKCRGQKRPIGCPDCNLVDCRPLDYDSCLDGIVKDRCKCCDVCAKGHGESCGEKYGTCGDNLSCVFASPTSTSGICECEEG